MPEEIFNTSEGRFKDIDKLNEGDDIRVYYYSNLKDGELTRKTAIVTRRSQPLGARYPFASFANRDGEFRIKFDPQREDYFIYSQVSGKELGKLRKIVRTKSRFDKIEYA